MASNAEASDSHASGNNFVPHQPAPQQATTPDLSEVNVTSPWQAFQIYLMDKIASVRQMTFATRRPPQREISQESTDEETRDYEKELEEYMFFYGSQNVSLAPVFNLPQEILLKIFSLLSCQDLCNVAKVCRLWSKVSEDPLMWSARLVEDSQRWPVISSHTFIDKELRAKAPAKLAYLRCSPEFGGPSSPSMVRRRTANTSSYSSVVGVSNHVSNLWRTWFPRKNPRFLLSEGDAQLKFMRRILHDKFNAFVPVSMFSTDWFLNAGLTYQMDVEGRHLLFDLVTFGSGARVEEQLFQVVPPDPADNSGQELMEVDGEMIADPDEPMLRLGEDFRRFARLVDGLIFVINAESGPQEFKKRRCEYLAFVESLADRPTVPILFLSLVLENEDSRRFSCVEMARKLGLISLPNPWIICDGRSKGLHHVAEGFVWLVQRATT